MIFFCITLWQNAIVVTSVICERTLENIISSENQDFLWPRGVNIFCLFKSKTFSEEKKKKYTFSTHNGRGRGCTERLFQKFTSDVMQFAAISGEILVQKSVLLRQVWPPHYLKFYWYNYCLINFMFYWTEYGHIIFAKKAYIQFIFCS